MSSETKRKTLANCKLSEFSAQANRIRKQVYDYYHAINVPVILKEYADKYKDVGAESKDAVSKEFISSIFDAIMTEHPLETVSLIASLAFMTVDEAEELAPVEALEIVLECVFSQRVLDFFISVELLAGNDTGIILQVLIILKSLSSEMNTSVSESQNSTIDSAGSSSAGTTSVNA